MPLKIVVARQVIVGVPEVIEGKAPGVQFAAVFGDDGGPLAIFTFESRQGCS